MNKIRNGTRGKLAVTISQSDYKYILEHTVIDEQAFGLGAVKGDQITFKLSPDEIEEIQGYLAFEANHAKSRKLEKELDRLNDLLASYLETDR